MAANHINAQSPVFVWLTRSLIAVLVFIAKDIRDDVKKLNATVPALEQKISDMEKNEERMQNKIFSAIIKPVAKKEEELNIDELFKSAFR